MNSNSFMRVRVQKKYFFEFKFEFGKMIEFAALMLSLNHLCQVYDKFKFQSTFSRSSSAKNTKFSEIRIDKLFMPQVPLLCPIFTAIVSTYLLLTPFLHNPNPIYIVIVVFYILALCCYYVFIVKKIHLPGMRVFTVFMQKLMIVAETDWDQYNSLNL